jgi:hypothetical protein
VSLKHWIDEPSDLQTLSIPLGVPGSRSPRLLSCRGQGAGGESVGSESQLKAPTWRFFRIVFSQRHGGTAPVFAINGAKIA